MLKGRNYVRVTVGGKSLETGLAPVTTKAVVVTGVGNPPAKPKHGKKKKAAAKTSSSTGTTSSH